MPDPNQNPALIPQFKGQPWTLFDTIVSTSFLLGDTVAAVGATTPAINSNGEMIFFNAPGRSNSNTPWYTNLDTPGILSYGMEVWAMYLMFAFPAYPPTQNTGFDYTINAGVPPTIKLMEAILNFGVIDLNLGQENQTRFPCSRFGAGGGIYLNGGAGVTNIGQNSVPEGANVLKLPEPIEMPRTQNLDVKLKIAPEVRALIGTLAAPGVGSPLDPYVYGLEPAAGEDPEVVVNLPQPPFSIQLGLIGRRIKNTQYGQING
jgi:hypothetical protein